MSTLKSSQLPISEINLALGKIHSVRDRAMYLRKLSQENHVKRMVFARNRAEPESPAFILPSNHHVCETKPERIVRRFRSLNAVVEDKNPSSSQAKGNNIIESSGKQVSSTAQDVQKGLPQINYITNSKFNITKNYSCIKRNCGNNVPKVAITSSHSGVKIDKCSKKTSNMSSNIPRKQSSIFPTEFPKDFKSTNRDVKETELKKSRIPEFTRLMPRNFNEFHKPIATFAIQPYPEHDNNKSKLYPHKLKEIPRSAALRSFGDQKMAGSCTSNNKTPFNSPEYENRQPTKFSAIPTLKLDSHIPFHFTTVSKDHTTRICASSKNNKPVSPVGTSFPNGIYPLSAKRNNSSVLSDSLSVDSLEECKKLSYPVLYKFRNAADKKDEVLDSNKEDHQSIAKSHQVNNYPISVLKCEGHKYNSKLSMKIESKNLKNLAKVAYKLEQKKESEAEINFDQSANDFKSDLFLSLKSELINHRQTDLSIEDKCNLTKENPTFPSTTTTIETMLISEPDKNSVSSKEVILGNGDFEKFMQDSISESESIAVENCSRVNRRHSFDAIVDCKKGDAFLSVNLPTKGNTEHGNMNEKFTRSIALNPKILTSSKISGADEGRQRITATSSSKLQNITEIKENDFDMSYSSSGNDFLIKPLEKFMNEINHSLDNTELEGMEHEATPFTRENRVFKGRRSENKLNGISPQSFSKFF